MPEPSMRQNATVAPILPRVVLRSPPATAAQLAAVTLLSLAAQPTDSPSTRRTRSPALPRTQDPETGRPGVAIRTVKLYLAALYCVTLTGGHSEGTTGRALTYGLGGVTGSDMTIAKCTAGCEAAGYPLAGAEYGGECCKS